MPQQCPLRKHPVRGIRIGEWRVRHGYRRPSPIHDRKCSLASQRLFGSETIIDSLGRLLEEYVSLHFDIVSLLVSPATCRQKSARGTRCLLTHRVNFCCQRLAGDSGDGCKRHIASSAIAGNDCACCLTRYSQEAKRTTGRSSDNDTGK